MDKNLGSNIMKTQGLVVMMVKEADLKWFEVLLLELPVEEGDGQSIRQKLSHFEGGNKWVLECVA